MFRLPNKFVFFTNQKQPLKFFKKNSYLHLWSNTLDNTWDLQAGETATSSVTVTMRI